MGSTLCSANHQTLKPDIFKYIYGQDTKEIKILHNDTIQSSLESIRSQLLDCQTRLKQSQRRFKDVTMEIEPILLSSGDKELHCTYERPEVFLKSEGSRANKIYKILDAKNCNPKNIVLGDQLLQYFGVFLCYLSHNPQLIDRIILTHQNTYGIHALQVIYEGQREVIYIDDYILCVKKKPLFCKPINNTDMWPCLLEKAWFKIKSCLKSKINSVHPTQVFTTFLSYPLRKFQITDSSQHNKSVITKYLINAKISGKGSGCIITTKAKPSHKIGLSGGRYFYFLGGLEFQGNFYFYLRNPCENFDFRGTMLQLPPLLQNQIQRLTGEKLAPGNFLLTYDEFEQQVQSFFIVHYNPSSSIASEQLISFANNSDAECYVKFQITKQQEISIRLQQLSNSQLYAPLTYLLLDVDRKLVVSGEKNEKGCFGVPQTSSLLITVDLLDSLHKTFSPGTYILRMKKKTLNTLQNINTKDRLIMSANQNIKFEVAEAGQLKKQFTFVAKEIAKKLLNQDKNAFRDQIEHKVVWMGDIVVIYINKLNTGKSVINLEVHFPELTNLQCLSHEIKIGYNSLPPFEKDVLIVFEKSSLTESTSLGKYSLTPY